MELLFLIFAFFLTTFLAMYMYYRSEYDYYVSRGGKLTFKEWFFKNYNV